MNPPHWHGRDRLPVSRLAAGTELDRIRLNAISQSFIFSVRAELADTADCKAQTSHP